MATLPGQASKNRPTIPAIKPTDPTQVLVPELHVGFCAECRKLVTRQSFFVSTGPGKPNNTYHLSCAPRKLTLLCSAKANCMRCGEALDARSVAIDVMSRSCRVHAQCRDIFAHNPQPPAEIVAL